TITEPDPIVVFIGFALPFVAQLYSVLSRGVTLGERLVLIAAVQVRRPMLLGRSLRFLFGIGGYMVLSQWTFPLFGLLLFARLARHGLHHPTPPRTGVRGVGNRDR